VNMINVINTQHQHDERSTCKQRCQSHKRGWRAVLVYLSCAAGWKRVWSRRCRSRARPSLTDCSDNGGRAPCLREVVPVSLGTRCTLLRCGVGGGRTIDCYLGVTRVRRSGWCGGRRWRRAWGAGSPMWTRRVARKLATVIRQEVPEEVIK
jgi:hypothetical protein